MTSTIKPLLINKLNSTINPLINNITDDDLKSSVDTYYKKEVEKLNNIESLSEIYNTFNSILSDTNSYIKTETEKLLISLKNKALEEINPYLTTLINKIPYEEVKSDVNTYYNTLKKNLEDSTSIDDVKSWSSNTKTSLEKFALNEAKKVALSKLDDAVTIGLNKLANKELKEDLNTFKTKEVEKLNNVETLDDLKSTTTEVLSEVEAHIKSLLATTVKSYISSLTQIETATAYDYIPDSMKPSYQNNLVDTSKIAYDFTSTTNVSDILKQGFGEQWQMVIENINQSVMMAKVSNVGQTVLTAAGNALDIFVENSYADTMSHEFEGDSYTAYFSFDGDLLKFYIYFKSSVEVPGFGELKPTVLMEYDLSSQAKGMYISLGDKYKVKYVISDNFYEMATTYGLEVSGKDVSRSSYLSISKDNNKTVGHIYEYTTYEGSDKIKACADFYVENGYVSVVGNKASGMVAFKGYVNELYLENEGRLLGYEVREDLTVAGITGTYNTIWFNLWDISGINKIKVEDKSDKNTSSRSTADVYINDSSDLFIPTYNTKLVKTSRKYDVELRTRYYYSYDKENDKYVSTEVKIPMMFIQEGDNYNSFEKDVKSDNGLELSVSLSQTYLNKILADYDTLIDVFI